MKITTMVIVKKADRFHITENIICSIMVKTSAPEKEIEQMSWTEKNDEPTPVFSIKEKQKQK